MRERTKMECERSRTKTFEFADILEQKRFRFTSFGHFQWLNKLRCNEAFHHVHSWPIERWALAVAGKGGELCNLVKKVIRGDYRGREKEAARAITAELADLITYADLLMTYLGADTGEELARKFEEVSKKIGWDEIEAVKRAQAFRKEEEGKGGLL